MYTVYEIISNIKLPICSAPDKKGADFMANQLKAIYKGRKIVVIKAPEKPKK